MLSSDPTNPKSVSSIQDCLLDRGTVSSYPGVLPRQEPTLCTLYPRGIQWMLDEFEEENACLKDTLLPAE